MAVGFNFPKLRFLHIESGVKLTLEPKSHEARSIETFPIKQWMDKLLESLSLVGSLFWITTLHSSVKAIVSCSSSFLLLEKSLQKPSIQRHLKQSIGEWDINVKSL